MARDPILDDMAKFGLFYNLAKGDPIVTDMMMDKANADEAQRQQRDVVARDAKKPAAPASRVSDEEADRLMASAFGTPTSFETEGPNAQAMRNIRQEGPGETYQREKNAVSTGEMRAANVGDLTNGEQIDIAHPQQTGATNPIPEDTWRQTGEKVLQHVVPNLESSTGGAVQGLVETAASPFGAVPGGDKAYDAAAHWLNLPSSAQVADKVVKNLFPDGVPGAQMAADANAELDRNAFHPGDSAAKYYVGQMADSLVQMLPAIGVTIATKNPDIGLAVMGGQVGGQQYGQSREQGRDITQARQDAAFNAAAELLGEELPLGNILKPGGGHLLTDVLKTAGLEGAQEMFTQALQTGYAAGVLNEKMTLGQGLKQVLDAGIIGAGMGVGMHVAAHPFTSHGQAETLLPELGARPTPPGVIEQAGQQGAQLTPEDIASPLPNDLIAAGKSTIASAGAANQADTILANAGLPPTQSRVVIRDADGAVQHGTIEDAFSGDDGAGVHIRLDDGKPWSEHFDDIRDAGVTIERAPQTATEINTAMHQRAESTKAAFGDALQNVEMPAPEEAASAAPAAPVASPVATSTPNPNAPVTKGVSAQIVDYLQQKGLSEAQARGIAAGIHAESGSNPNAVNPTSGALGIGQWLGARKQAIIQRYGANPTLEQQLDFLVDELRGGDPGGKNVLAQQDEAAVLQHYVTDFMRPAKGAETSGDMKRGMDALGRPNDTTAIASAAGSEAAGSAAAAPGEANPYEGPLKDYLAGNQESGQPEALNQSPLIHEAASEPGQAEQPSAKLDLQNLAPPAAENTSQNRQSFPDIRGEHVDQEFRRFTPESGTLNIPRADMPQIAAEHRGAMVNFLNARGIAHQEEVVPAASLKPTQAEFSEAKVEKAKQYEGGDRAILVSSDGYVLDGHHQWMAARDQGQDIRAIRLDAPIDQLINTVRDMPSATTESGEKAAEVPQGVAPATDATPAEPVTTPRRPAKNANALVQQGQKVTFSEQVGYLGGAGRENDTYTVQNAGRGEAYFVNDRTGAGSSLKNYEMQAALKRGVMQVQPLQVGPAADTQAAPVGDTTVPPAQTTMPGGTVPAEASNQAPKASRKVRSDKTLLEFIADRGGINDTGGDLASMGLDKWHRQKAFRKKLLRPFDAKAALGGISGAGDYGIDSTLRAAIDAGYFPELANAANEPGVSHLDGSVLMKAIADEIDGKPRYSSESKAFQRQQESTPDESVPEATDAERLAVYSDWIHDVATREFGIDAADLDSDFLEYAAKLRLAGMDERDAFVRAVNDYADEYGQRLFEDTSDPRYEDFHEAAPFEQPQRTAEDLASEEGSARQARLPEDEARSEGGGEPAQQDRSGKGQEGLAEATTLDRGEAVNPAIAERQRQEAQLRAEAPMRGENKTGQAQDGTMGLGLFDAADQSQLDLSQTRPAAGQEPSSGGRVEVPQATAAGPEAALPPAASAPAAGSETPTLFSRTEGEPTPKLTPDAIEAARDIAPVVPKRDASTLAGARLHGRTLVGQSLRNEETGLIAHISNSTLGKMTSLSAVKNSTSASDHALAVANLDRIFATAHQFERAADARDQDTAPKARGVRFVRRFVGSLQTPDGPVAVRMVVKQTAGANAPNPFYTIETIDVLREGESGPATQAPSEDGIEPAPGRNLQTGATGPTTDVAQSEENATPPDAKGDVRRFVAPDNGQKTSTDWSETAERIKARLAQLGLDDKVRVALVGVIDGNPKIAGSIHDNLITLALASRQDAEATLNHEAVHALRGLGLFTDGEWTSLTRDAARDTALMQSVERRYHGLDREGLLEEAVADRFMRWSQGQQEKGFIARAFGRVAEFFRSLGQALRGEGFTTAESVMRAMGRGDVGARETGEGAAGERQSRVADLVGLADLETQYPAESEEEYRVSSPAGGARVNSVERVRREALRQSMNLGQYDENFDKIMAWKGGEANFGDVTIGRGTATDLDARGLRRFALTDAPFEREAYAPETEETRPNVTSMLGSLGGGGKLAAIQSSVDDWRIALQDKMLPVLRLQETAEAALGRKLTDAENPYQAEELMTGRAGAKLERLVEDRIDPLFQAMHEEGVSVDELETYLYARHAPERNAQIAKINPDFGPGEGSGMTDTQARAVLNRIDREGKTETMRGLAGMVDNILADSLKTRVDAGLLSQQEADAWRQTYKHYVPLRGQLEVEGDASGIAARIRQQSGVSVKGKESRRAFGRKSQADNILAYTILQAEEAIVRAEKNGAAQAFLALAKAHPDPDFWTIDKIERRPVLDSTTGQVRYENQSRLSAEDAPFTVTAKVGGEEHRITMNRSNRAAVQVADAMRNLDTPKFGRVMAFASRVNQAFSAVNTRFNPAFVVTNALRDIQTMVVTLQQFDMPGLTRRVLADYPKAMFATKEGDGEWSKWRRQWELAGGKIYYNQTGDLNAIRKDIERRVQRADNPNRAAELWHKAFDYLEAMNEGVERAIRLSVFKNARELGASVPQAASMSRNVTVNFTRKGKYGPALNAFYAFFNASMQGSATLMRAAAKSNKVRGAMAGFVVAGFLSDLLNSMVSGKDDDDQSYWDKVPSTEKARNAMFMTGGPNGAAVKIPLAYGLNVLFGIGRNLSAVMRGAMKPGEAAMSSALDFADAFNPIGSGGSWKNTVAPTALDPFIDVSDNRDFMGKPIQPDQDPFGSPATPSSNYFPNASAWAKKVASTVNRATGGDDVLPGAVSVSPNVIDYFAGYATGGAGRFLQDIAKLVTAANDPEADVTIHDIPVAKSVVTDKATWVDKSTFFDRTHQVKAVLDHAKEYHDRGDAEGLARFVEENRTIGEMRGATTEASKLMAEARKSRNTATFQHELGRLSDADYTARLDRVKEVENRVIAAYNKRWNEVVGTNGGN